MLSFLVSTSSLLVVHVVVAAAASVSSSSYSIDAETALLTRHDNDETQHRASSLNASLSSRTQPQTLSCGIWLAPSTIPGAGIGMYAGRDFMPDEPLQTTGDLVISIVDIRMHSNDMNWLFLWDEYTWNAEALNMDHEGFADVNAASFGFGAAANCNLPILNMEEWNPSILPLDLHRSRDPGAGAYTPWGNRTATALLSIPKGSELFVSYGESWFESREFLGPIPMTDDLDRATALFKKYKELYKKTTARQEVLETVWEEFIYNTSFVNSRVLVGAFNKSDPTELQILNEKNLTQLRREKSIRTTEWLEQHGTCGDHLAPAPSTIKQAGHGAFAQRFLPKGTIVSYLPLIHVANRSNFNMYHFDPESLKQGKPIPNPSLGIASQQLLLNYCFGHPQSTLLLCPYGPMSGYINHNQTQANLRLVWSDPERGNHMPHLLLYDIAHLESDSTAKLAFDVVALRDIKQGEEVFLDYGDDWEQAWQEHVASWKPVPGAERYKSAFELNADKTSRIPTEFESIDDPSLARPEVELWCNNLFKLPVWREHKANGTLDSFMREGDAKIYKCDNMQVTTDDDGSFLYSVVLWYEDKTKGHAAEYIDHMEDVPREAFMWYDRPYSTDIFMPNAFRHHMGIPDNMFPHKWRNADEVSFL